MKLESNWPMSHAKHVTRDNRKNREYHVVVAIRKLRTETVPQENHGQTMLKNEQHIGSFTDPTSTGSIFVCGPLHHYVNLKALTLTLSP